MTRFFAKVASSLGAEAADLQATGGRVQLKSDSTKGIAWKDACKLLGVEPVTADGAFQPQGLSSIGTSGVQFADVEVDIETGVTRVKKIVCVQDCGMIVDKLTAESQCIGGIIMGLGFALFENRILDRNTAHMVNPNMEWYLLPGHLGHPDDRRHARRSAGPRHHRSRRAAGHLDRRRCGERRRQRDRRPRAAFAADA